MLDAFLKVAFAQSREEDERAQTHEILRKLPQDLLFKLANGELKMADCGPSEGCENAVTWLDQFKDTPLFEQALALEQKSIQVETLQQQNQAQQDAERKEREASQPDFYAVKDQIRLQKKMLGLELSSQQLQAAGGALPPAGPPPAEPAAVPAPAAGAQGGGAPGPETAPPGPKLAFAVTRKGHRFDAEKARMEEAHSLDTARLLQAYDAIGYQDPETGKNPARFLNLLRFLPKEPVHPTMEARHQRYVAGKHEQGQNAWNPLGGILTHHPEEEGGTSGWSSILGKVKEKKAAAELVDHAIELGQRLARHDMEKAANFNAAAEMGSVLAKTALSVLHGHMQDRDEQKMDKAYEKYEAAHTGAQQLRSILSTIGGGGAGAGLGAGAGYLGSKGVNAVAGRSVLNPTAAASIGGSVGGTLGIVTGGIVGGSHGEPDIRLGKMHEKLVRQEEAYDKKMSKQALAPGALGGLATGAANFLKANRGAAIGAGIGAAGGLMNGMQKDQQGNRHILSGLAQGAAGGVAGAALGHGAQHFSKAMAHSGGNVGESLSATGRQLQYQGGRAATAVTGAMGGAGGVAKTQSMSPALAATQPMSAVAPTMNGMTPMHLSQPKPMPQRIPTGMINGAAYGG